MPTHYPNAECLWHRDVEAGVIDRQEVTCRLGPVDEELRWLSGGLANANIRIGTDRVLRIYRRDVSALDLELRLLSQAWETFQVPRVLGRGADFLLLEHVPHRPLGDSGKEGSTVGAALAEIHQFQFDTCGTLDEGLQVVEAWADFPQMMVQYVTNALAASQDVRLFDAVLETLESRRSALLSACDRPTLLHGDFKASNLHWTPADRLLVLDWEFAYSGPAYMDLGQLSRWGMPSSFQFGFESAYSAKKLEPSNDLPWREAAAVFDLVNLVGLLVRSEPTSRRALDCRQRIGEIVSA